MGLRLNICFAVGALAGSLCTLPASADGRSAGQTLVYDIVSVSNTTTDFSSVPALVRQQAEATLAQVNGKKFTTNLRLTLDQVDAAGNAHFIASSTRSMEGASAMAARSLAAPRRFQGTLSADGQLLPAYDPKQKYSFNAQPTEAEMENTFAQEMHVTFATFNALISGYTKHPHLKIGDAWSAAIQDVTTGQTLECAFSVRADPGSGAPVIAMKAQNPGGAYTVSASGHYDAARRLLVDYHEDTSHTSAKTSGTSSTDFTLRQ